MRWSKEKGGTLSNTNKNIAESFPFINDSEFNFLKYLPINTDKNISSIILYYQQNNW